MKRRNLKETYNDCWKALSNKSQTEKNKKETYVNIILAMYECRPNFLFLNIFLQRLFRDGKLANLKDSGFKGKKLNFSKEDLDGSDYEDYNLLYTFDIIAILEGLVIFSQTKSAKQLTPVFNLYKKKLFKSPYSFSQWFDFSSQASHVLGYNHDSETVSKLICKLDEELVNDEIELRRKANAATATVKKHRNIPAEPQPAPLSFEPPKAVNPIQFEAPQTVLELIAKLSEVNKSLASNFGINEILSIQKKVRLHDLSGLINAAYSLKLHNSAESINLYQRFFRTFSKLGATKIDIDKFSRGIKERKRTFDSFSSVDMYEKERQLLFDEIDASRTGLSAVDLITFNALAWEIPDNDLLELLMIFKDFEKSPSVMKEKDILFAIEYELAQLGLRKISPHKNDNTIFNIDRHYAVNSVISAKEKKVVRTISPGYQKWDRVILVADVDVE